MQIYTPVQKLTADVFPLIFNHNYVTIVLNYIKYVN